MIRPLSFLAVSALALHGCAQSSDTRLVPMVVGFYNLENLFDTIDQPDVQDEEFLPNGTNQWTGARYREKLGHMAHVIGEMGTNVQPGGIAVLGVSEVENRSVRAFSPITRTRSSGKPSGQVACTSSTMSKVTPGVAARG